MSDSRKLQPPRLAVIDMARAGALIAMVIYHFFWDLSYHGLIASDVGRAPLWHSFAAAIAASFLFLSGFSFALATQRNFDLPHFGLRLLKIGGAAAFISLATYLLFPNVWIFFGILHMIAAGSLILVFFWKAKIRSILVGVGAALILPELVRGGIFNAPPLAFLGLQERPPPSNDFIPIFPWIAPMLLGLATGKAWLRQLFPLPNIEAKQGFTRALAVTGRWTLALYLLHQPLIFSAVAGLAAILPPDPKIERLRFLRDCKAQYQADGGKAENAARFCGCVADSVEGTDFWKVRGGDPAMSALVEVAAGNCRAATPSQE